MQKESSIRVVVRFDIQPEQLPELRRAIKDFIENVVSKIDGFVSAQFHKNDEDTVLLNYATWASKGAFQNFLNSDAPQSDYGKKVMAFEPDSVVLTPIEL